MVSSGVTTVVVTVQVLLLACVVRASPVQESGGDKKLESVVVVTEPGGLQQVTTPATPTGDSRDVSILKQINKVNDDGSYTFGYEASDGSFKVETRDVTGNVKGMFGFVDETGNLKRVSYSASNSSGFQTAAAAAGTTSSPSGSSGGSVTTPLSFVQKIPVGGKKKDDDADDDDTKSTGGGVKKVLVSKRPVQLRSADESDHRRREGNDLRRQLPRNDGDDAPDVYGVHGRSSMQSGPVSPVVSALMSELDDRVQYRPSPPTFARPETISRQAEVEDEETVQYRPVHVRYRQQYQQQPIVAYQQPIPYPVYQQQQPQPVLYPAAAVYSPSLTALRDELMELILSFVQARVSQLMPSVPASYRQPSTPALPYQQPNYYVPSYYQGPRVSSGGITQQQQQFQQLQRDGYAADPQLQLQQSSSSPRVTQTLKDGLIRMLLSTSPRYDSDRVGLDRSTPARLAYRSTTQPTTTPVRSVQIIGEDDGSSSDLDTRPVTTETPD